MLKFVIVFLVLLLTASICPANDQAAPTDLNVKTVQAKFIQAKHLALLKKPIISEGLFMWSSPDAVRWEYTLPEPSVIIMKGSIIKRFFKMDGHWVEDSAFQAQGFGLMLDGIGNWTAGNFDENPYFMAERSTPNSLKIILTPRNKGFKGYVDKIEITLGKTPGVIKSIWVVESPKAKTLFTFNDVQVNQPLAKQTFQNP